MKYAKQIEDLNAERQAAEAVHRQAALEHGENPSPASQKALDAATAKLEQIKGRIATASAARDGALDRQREHEGEAARREKAERAERLRAVYSELSAIVAEVDGLIDSMAEKHQRAAQLTEEVLKLRPGGALIERINNANFHLPYCIGFRLRSPGFPVPMWTEPERAVWARYFPDEAEALRLAKLS